MEIFRIVVLALSGLLICYAGSMRLVRPAGSFCLQTYLTKPENRLEDDPDMASEMRGAGAALLVAGLVTLLGIVVPDARTTSFAVAAVIYGGFALGRLVSWSVDGKPNKDLVQGTMSETVLAVLNLIALATVLL